MKRWIDLVVLLLLGMAWYFIGYQRGVVHVLKQVHPSRMEAYEQQ